MVNFYIYAKDFSGSTNSNNHYHSNGFRTIDKFKSDVEKIEKEILIPGEPPTESKVIYLHWGHNCVEVDENTTKATYLDKEGDGVATQPDTIIDWLLNNYDICGENNKIKLLYIITDGLIDYETTEKCFKLNENMHYESVVFYAFNENPREIDFSVATSFFKSRCIVYSNSKLYDSTDISEEFDYAKINGDNFEVEIDSLRSYIKFKFIKKINDDARALQEIDKLKKLRDRLFKELPLETREKCQLNLETKDRGVFLRDFVRTDWYKNLTETVYKTRTKVDKYITTLINYIVSDQKSYSFDALKFDKTFDTSVEEEPMIDVNFPDEQEIKFPDIILDDEQGIPVIILTEYNLLNKIIFRRKRRGPPIKMSYANFSKFKSAMDCPLFLVKSEGISKSIGYFYTFNVYKRLLRSGRMTEPRTRRPFHGGLVLTDDDHFDKYNDYILALTYFNSKKVIYNVGLFYYTLWKNCENKEWMDKNVVERFKKYTMRRISKTVCKIGLSSLPLDPHENTSLLTALWYCVELSSCIFKDDPQNFRHERLRMYFGVTNCIIEILKYFNYHLDIRSIKRRKDLIINIIALKKIPKRSDKLYYLLERIFKTVNGFLVSEIEKPFHLYKLNYLKLDHKSMLSDDVIEEKVHLNDYIHLMHSETMNNSVPVNDGTFEICQKTFRPYFTLDINTSFYPQLLKATKKVVIRNDDDKDKIEVRYEATDSLEFDKILSLYNLYINCVKDLDKYPTLREYTNYIIKKKKINGDLVTIFPSNIFLNAKIVFKRYQKVVKKVDVKEFISVSKKYVSRTERIKAEEIFKFNNDEEINEFISNEELKINLIKKIK